MKEDTNKKVQTVPEREENILKFWNDNNIFKKTLKGDAPKGPARTDNGRGGEFVFYDGPPFATGQPHYGHILAGTIKDVIPRYKTMRGYTVPRQWGWDCHGLPIENLIEKELGLQTKKDIEDLGVAKFNKAAKDSVLRYSDDWKKIIPRAGRFVDMEHDYKTMDSNFTESVWWVFKTLYDKGLIYMGHKSMHICPRCETTLANFEVSQGYKDVTDLSLTAKFELIDEPGLSESPVGGAGTFILAWTTTPWTLPGNVALAVGENIDYVKIEKDGVRLILAKERLSKIEGEYKVIAEFKGSDLVGKKYKPLFDYYSKKEDLENRENGWKIYSAPFVTTQDGVGVVHIAPAFGDDDMKLGKEKNLPFVQHVGMDGKFRPDVSDFVGIPVKPKDDNQSTDVLIIKNLAGRGLLFSKEKIIHSYPHCWRCDTPLLNYAASSWFVKVTAIKDKMIANNQKINWVPENLRDGRFGKWLEGAQDWAISRSRYWGAPLPVWKCKKCDELKVIGSVEDLKKNEEISGNLYFIMRHGQADSNIKEVLSSEKFQKDNHLTEKGKEQVKATALKLKEEGIDLIISSDYIRTAETAKIVAEKVGIDTANIVFDKRLRELQVGDLDGVSNQEYHNYFSEKIERFTKNAPNGENHTDTKNRVTEVLFELDKKYQNKKILIVSHGDPLWVLVAGSKGLDAGKAVNIKDDVYLDNAEYKKLDFTPFPHNENYELDLHKPFIDEISFDCSCGEKMKRVPEVFDCWFESGAMPYGQAHYPFENKESFERNFPAQFIAEGLDQTRGWFYSLMVLSTALFDKPAFTNVIVNGLVLAEDGQKMSKRLKNYPDIMYVINKYGADALRYYMLSSPVVKSEDLRFTEKGVDEVYKKIILRLNNVYSFLEMYEGSEKRKAKNEKETTSENILDKWIMARLGEITKEITEALEKYELDKAVRPIEGFVDDLSTWYLRRSRDRFKGDDVGDKENALNTLKLVIRNLSVLMAPFMPFISDYLYKKEDSEDKESVHLENWPQVSAFDGDILNKMNVTRKIVSLGLEARMKAGIKVRQPLNELRIKNNELQNNPEYLELIKDEMNIKNVSFNKDLVLEVELDTEISDELREEGGLRDFVRNIQEIRKNSGFNPNDKAIMEIFCGETEKEFLKKFKSEIEKGAGIKEFIFKETTLANKIEASRLSFEISLFV